MKAGTDRKKTMHIAAGEAGRPWTKLVRRNMPLVKYVLGKINGKLPPCVDRDDLLAAGAMGLVEAARKYDASRKTPFHSYAIPRIWGAMLDELRKEDRLSTDMRDQVNKMDKAAAALREKGISHPGIADIAERLDCSPRRVARLMSLADTAKRRTGMDSPATESTRRGLYERVGTAPMRSPFEAAEFNDRKETLARAMQALPEREKHVIVLRYNEGLYLHEIGKLLAVSESRVCQIHGQALRRLRIALERAGLSAS